MEIPPTGGKKYRTIRTDRGAVSQWSPGGLVSTWSRTGFVAIRSPASALKSLGV
jgi:hypothetical protein